MPTDRGPLGNFLQKKYIEWINQLGEVKSQAEFAAYLGIDPVALNRYLNGKRRQLDQETAAKLAEVLGEEVYLVMGFTNPKKQKLYEELAKLDEEGQQEVLEYIQKMNSKRQRGAEIGS